MKQAWEFDGDAPSAKWQARRFCNFGIIEGTLALVAALGTASAAGGAAIAGGLTGLGVGATTAGILGEVGMGALAGAGFGSASSAIMGQDPLKGAEFGAITGGALGAAGPLAEGLGISATGADLLAGTAGGALGGLATGQDIGKSAISGGLSGLATSALNGLTAKPTGSASAPTGGGTGTAASVAAPASVAGGSPDVTAGIDAGAGITAGGPGSFGPLASTGAGSLTAGNLPGSIGAGAASGVPSAVGGAIQAPNIAADVNVGNVSSALPAINDAGGGGFLSKAGDFLSNPSNLLTTGMLGAGLLKGNQTPAGYDNLQALAKQDVAQGGQLQSYLASGTLPPGMQASVNQATSSAEAAIRQQYANRGMSGSSAEAQDLANVKASAQAQGANMAIQLLQQGMQQSQLGQQIYDELMRVNMQQDEALSSALTNFAGSMAGLNRPIQINAGGG